MNEVGILNPARVAGGFWPELHGRQLRTVDAACRQQSRWLISQSGREMMPGEHSVRRRRGDGESR